MKSPRMVYYSAYDPFDIWRDAFAAAMPELALIPADAVEDPDAIDYAVVWKAPPGFFDRFRNLRLVVNLGAGVDAIVARPDRPRVPVIRISDPAMGRMMAGYVLFAVLRIAREIPHFEAAQRRREWAYRHPRSPEDIAVAVLGLGELGAMAASELARQGFTVLGWSRSPKAIDGVDCRHGDDALAGVLAAAEIVVVMLPLTAGTRGLLDAGRLASLRRGAHLINVSRGAVVDHAAMVAALESGQLGGATLDVFDREPLPPDDPLWAMPQVLITPHLASVALPRSAASGIAAEIGRLMRGESLRHRVDLDRGY